LAIFVVEVAEGFVAERWTAATASVGEDVAALEALDFWCVHETPPLGYFVGKILV